MAYRVIRVVIANMQLVGLKDKYEAVPRRGVDMNKKFCISSLRLRYDELTD